MLVKRISRSILCKMLYDDVLLFCISNPFRLSKAVLTLYFKYYKYNSINFNFYKKFKIFYKKSITLFNRRKVYSYFIKFKLLKKKIMLFFGFTTYKQLIYSFNNIYFFKTKLLFYYIFTLFELRLDFLFLRIFFLFTIYLSRLFIKKYGVIINKKRIIFNYLFNINIGDYFQIFLPNSKLIIYNKFYRFWFNEYIYKGNFLKLKIYYKLLILKKLQNNFKYIRFLKKKKFFNIFLKKKLKFNFNTNIKISYDLFFLIKKLFLIQIIFYKYLFNIFKKLIIYLMIKLLYLFYKFFIFFNLFLSNLLFIFNLNINNFIYILNDIKIILINNFLNKDIQKLNLFNIFFYLNLFVYKNFFINYRLFTISKLNFNFINNNNNNNNFYNFFFLNYSKKKIFLSRTITNLSNKSLSKHIILFDFLSKFFKKKKRWLYLHRYTNQYFIKRYFFFRFKFHKFFKYKRVNLKIKKNLKKRIFFFQSFKFYNKLSQKKKFFLRFLSYFKWIRFFFKVVNKYNKYSYFKHNLIKLYFKFKKRYLKNFQKKKKKIIIKNLKISFYKKFNFLINKKIIKINTFKNKKFYIYYNNIIRYNFKKLFFNFYFKTNYFFKKYNNINKKNNNFNLFFNFFELNYSLFFLLFNKKNLNLFKIPGFFINVFNLLYFFMHKLNFNINLLKKKNLFFFLKINIKKLKKFLILNQTKKIIFFNFNFFSFFFLFII
jgi:ribosomal protein S4